MGAHTLGRLIGPRPGRAEAQWCGGEWRSAPHCQRLQLGSCLPVAPLGTWVGACRTCHRPQPSLAWPQKASHGGVRMMPIIPYMWVAL